MRIVWGSIGVWLQFIALINLLKFYTIFSFEFAYDSR